MSNWWVPLDIGVVQGLILACAVLGFSIALRVLRFPDLTVEASLLLGGAAYAVAITHGKSIGLSFALALIIGAVAGAITATLHTRLCLNKFLAGILVIAAAYSLSLRLMGGSNIGLLDAPNPLERVQSWNDNGPKDTHIGDVFALGLLTAGVCFGLVMLLKSRTGMKLRAAGCNPLHARAIAVDPAWYLVGGIALMNALAAFSGALLAMYQGFSDVSMGQGTLIIALASMTIGERLTASSRWPEYLSVVVAAVAGSILYQWIIAVAVRMGLAATDLKLATAIIVLIVVAVRAAKKDDLLAESI